MSVISDAASHGAPVELERLDGEVVVVTLSRHAERNALSRDVLEALFEALEVAATGARAMVLTGGPDVFCAGGDLGFLHRALAAGNHAEVRETLFLLVDVVRRLRALPMPTIAAVEGLAVGAGLALAFGADIRIAGRRASFIPGYLAVGASPDGGVRSWTTAPLSNGQSPWRAVSPSSRRTRSSSRGKCWTPRRRSDSSPARSGGGGVRTAPRYACLP